MGRKKGLNFSDVTLVSDGDIAINVHHYGNFRLLNQKRRQVQKYKNLLSRTGSFMPLGIHQLLYSTTLLLLLEMTKSRKETSSKIQKFIE